MDFTDLIPAYEEEIKRIRKLRKRFDRLSKEYHTCTCMIDDLLYSIRQMEKHDRRPLPTVKYRNIV